MTSLSAILPVTDDDDLVVVEMRRDITGLDEMAVLFAHLRDLDALFVEIMSGHPNPDIARRIKTASVESIEAYSPITIVLNVDPTFLGIAAMVLYVIQNYPELRSNLDMIRRDLQSILQHMEGMSHQLVDYVVEAVMEALEAYAQARAKAWEALRKKTEAFRDFFTQQSEEGDVKFRIEEMEGT